MLYGVKKIYSFYAQKFYLKDINFVIREEFMNPSKILLDWVHVEILS